MVREKPETSVRWKAHTGQECVCTLTLQSTPSKRTPLSDGHLVLVQAVFSTRWTPLSDRQVTLLKLSTDNWEVVYAAKNTSKQM